MSSRDRYDTRSKCCAAPSSIAIRDGRAELLGKLIVRRNGRKQLAGRIVEIEAYLGAGDCSTRRSDTRAQCRALGASGTRLHLLHLWRSLLPEYFLPARRRCGLRADSRLEPMSGIREMAEARGLADLDLTPVRDLRKLATVRESCAKRWHYASARQR